MNSWRLLLSGFAVHPLNYILIVLHFIAAGVFGFLLILDYNARERWTAAVQEHQLRWQGLPMQGETGSFSSARDVRDPTFIDSTAVKSEAAKRIPSAKGEFRDVNEVFGNRITTANLSDSAVNKLLSGTEGGTNIRTLEEELNRVEQGLFSDIENLARSVAESQQLDEAQKRGFAQFMLLPLATSTSQIDAINRMIFQSKANALSTLLEDAVQRRLLGDLLRVLHGRRGLPDGEKILKNVIDARQVPIENLKDAVRQHFAEARSEQRTDLPDAQNGNVLPRPRTAYDKRNAIGYVLVAVSKLQRPDVNPLQAKDNAQYLYPNGSERALAVLGFDQYNRSLAELAEVIARRYEDVLTMIQNDRDGTIVQKDGKPVLLEGFVGKYQDLVNRLVNLVAEIQTRQSQLALLQGQLKRAQELHAERMDDYNGILKQILATRDETAKLVDRLREYERQLFQAQREFSDAAAANLRLEREIRKLEEQASGASSTQ